MPSETRARYDVIQWLMFQMGGIGPMLGQVHHFRAYAPEQIPYAVNRYTNEAKRLYGVMDRRLEGREWFADDYSIADIAIFPWLRRSEEHTSELQSLMRISYAVFCLKKKQSKKSIITYNTKHRQHRQYVVYRT